MKKKTKVFMISVLAVVVLAILGTRLVGKKPSRQEVSALEQTPEEHLAFGKVLWDAYQKGVLPDDQVLDYISMEGASENSFALVDVDGDGQKELLLFWVNASMAGQKCHVFGYEDGGVYEEFMAFPSLRFYDNGMIEADWSHNQGVAGDFWPYYIYHHDAEKDVYEFLGGVDAWDRQVREENEEGMPFPTDLDADGDGILYYLLPADGSGHDEEYLVDGAEYESWRNDYLGEGEEIRIQSQKLTEENISALGYPKPDVPVPEPAG